jgi:hypothetical protein
MIKNSDLTNYTSSSKLNLKYHQDGSKIVVTNALEKKIAELNLQYVSEEIYNDSWYGFVTAEEFKEVMSGPYIDYFVNTKCTKKVCNTLNMEGGMDDETTKWFNQELFPRLLEGGISYNALVIPEDIFAQQTMEEFETNLGSKFGRVFPTFDKALEWLRRAN